MAKKNLYGKRPLWQWILICVIIGIIVYGGIYYFFLKKNGGYNYSASQSQNSSPTESPTNNSNWKTYTNTTYGYTVSYPNWATVNTKNNNVTTFIIQDNNKTTPAFVDVAVFKSSTYNYTDIGTFAPFDSKTIEHNGHIFAFIADSNQEGSSGDSAKNLAVDTMHKMYSTFKFTK